MILQFICVLLWAQIGNAPAAPTANMGSIEGSVVRLGTKEPLAEIHIALFGTGPGGAEDSDHPGATLTTSSDDAGRFSFKKLAPGTYRLVFFANGFVRQEYGQRTFPGSGLLIKLDPGETLKGIVAELTPTGSVSGTIRDKNEHPLTGVPVQLMRTAYDDDGKRTLKTIGSTTTDDRGMFRLYFVTPSRYYLQAGTPQGPPGYGGGITSGPNEFRVPYASAFYPGTEDPKFASTINVLPGDNVRGLDFIVKPIQTVRIRGRVVDAATGQPPGKLKVVLLYRDPVTGWEYSLEQSNRFGERTGDGVFEFLNVVPGSFTLAAGDDAWPPRRGRLPIEVADKDLENIVITLSSGSSISGRWKVDGQSTMQSPFDQYGPHRVGLSPLPGSIPEPPESSAGLNPDGTFRFEGVLPGDYHLWGRFKPNFYIKEAHFGPFDLLKGSVSVAGRETNTLDIVISSKFASLEGVVTDSRRDGTHEAQVMLIPDESQPTLHVKVARTDQNGRFMIPNIAPGDYKLYAWESIETNGWFDAELVKKFEPYAKPVHLSELAHPTVEVQRIPAAAQ